MANNKENKKNKALARFWDTLEGNFMTRYWSAKGASFILTFAVVAILLVFVSYISISLQTKLERTKYEVKELHMENVAVSSALVQNSRITAVEERVQKANLPIDTPDSSPIFLD